MDINPLAPPDLSLIAWHRDQQEAVPEPPYVMVYKAGEKTLALLAAVHQRGADSPSLQTAASLFQKIQPQAVVLEGIPNAPDAYATFINRIDHDQATHFKHTSESGLTAHLAHQAGNKVIRGEPAFSDVAQAFVRQGYTLQDAVCWNISRTLTQALTPASLTETNMPQQIQKWLNEESTALGIAPVQYAEFGHWFEQNNQQSLDFRTLSQVCPTSPHNTGFKKMWSIAEDTREPHIVMTIFNQLKEPHHDRVMVVYGHDHIARQTPVWTAAMGKPQIMKLSDLRPVSPCFL